MAGGATRRRGIVAEINVTPLVDIMLVLLIIFMLTAHLIAKQAIAVDLPKASQSAELPAITLNITLDREGVLYLDALRVTPDALRAAIKVAIAKDPKTQAVITGDKNVAHGRVVWVLDTIKSLGVTSFAIQIDPSVSTAPDVK
ncbi:MAG TPA: biopolymer transporter ExbD [Kofleriaceae bacterium]